MQIRRTRRGLRIPLAARLATVCTMAAAALTFTAGPASATVPCPDHGSPSGSIDHWYTLTQSQGVTLCEGNDSNFITRHGWLQMVDLGSGAKLRLLSEVDTAVNPPDPRNPYTKFRKRTAHDWYTHIRSGGSTANPDPDLLFSTTNASYFKDTENSNTTLTFPHRSGYIAETWGAAIWDEWYDNVFPRCPDPNAFDYCAAKKLLRIGTTSELPQKVSVSNMYTSFDEATAEAFLRDGHWSIGDAWPGAWDATVAFAPTVDVGSSGRRTYLGRYGNVVYIFTSESWYTSAQANAIMQEIMPGMNVMQLDGGGSTQFYSDNWSLDSITIPDREVPDVLAVYRAP